MTDHLPSLNSLDWLPYLDEMGKVCSLFAGKIGVYAIFDQEQILQYVGYSRDISFSLKQHLVRCPLACYGLKVTTIDKPNRTILEAIKEFWIQENGTIPLGNSSPSSLWNEPIDVKFLMTENEKKEFALSWDEISREKLLKNVARRIESEIFATLKKREITEEIRFNPKLKSSGLLDLK